jgi:hypothetical protein
MRFYMKHPHGLIAPMALRAVELFRERIRPFQFEWYDTLEGQLAPLDNTVWEKLRQKMLGPEDSGCIRLEDDRSRRIGGFRVDYRGLALPYPWPERKDDVSVLYTGLPTEYLQERGPEWVRALALEMVEALPLCSGYVDFAFNNTSWSPEFTEGVHTRYPGVHLDAHKMDFQVGTRVDGVHWLNFLGQPVLTLGDQPDPGDVEAGHSLPLHRALARILEPYLYHRARPLGQMTPEEQLRWERRFLD